MKKLSLVIVLVALGTTSCGEGDGYILPFPHPLSDFTIVDNGCSWFDDQKLAISSIVGSTRFESEEDGTRVWRERKDWVDCTVDLYIQLESEDGNLLELRVEATAWCDDPENSCEAIYVY